MSVEDFETQKYSVVKRLMAKFVNLDKETMYFWEHIQSEYLQFLRHETDATLIRNMTKDDLIEFYHQYINPMSKTRMKISIHLTAHPMVDESTEALETAPASEPIYIDDVGQFKASLPVGPGPVSFMPVEAFMPLSH
jgi:insulysin